MSDEKKNEEETIKELGVSEDIFDEHTQEEMDEANQRVLEFWKIALSPEIEALEADLHKLSKDSSFMSKFVAKIVKEDGR